MKRSFWKLIALAMIPIMLLGLTGCGKEETDTKTKSESGKDNTKVEEKIDRDKIYKDMERIDFKTGEGAYTRAFSVSVGYKKGTDWKKDTDMYSYDAGLTLISEEHKMRVELEIDINQIINYEGNLEKYKEQNKEGMFNEFTTKSGYKGFYRYDYNGVQKDMLVGSLRLDEVSKSTKNDTYRQIARINFKVYRADGVGSEREDVVKDFVIAELLENLTFQFED